MASIASVYVDVVPSTAAIAKGIHRALRDADRHVREAKQRWQKILSDPDAEIEVDTAKAEAKIDKVTRDRKGGSQVWQASGVTGSSPPASLLAALTLAYGVPCN